MRGFLLVGHGTLPEAFKYSLSMIVGDVSNVSTICLQPDQGKEDLKKKMQEMSDSFRDYEKVFVFADLLGGSPANAAVMEFLPQERYGLISGMNLPMLLTSILGPDTDLSAVLKAGRSGIQDMRKALDNPVSAVDEEKKTGIMEIRNVRIDARGIHGQVATAWVPKLGVNRIMVIDDLAVKDEMQKMALKMAKPNHIKLSILSTRKAAERLQEPGAYEGERLLVLIQRVETLKALAGHGYLFKEVNLGNVPARPGTTAYRKTVSLLPEEAAIIRELIAKGTYFTAQMVPNDNPDDFNSIIDK
ncbi:phosphotransferase system mannose-type iia component [Lucifera butyrica]|uniref:PTS system mannose-specific EIIAB component n=1 Tax=Lucifera butyrica TaxID=1351585 RepID=A0A498R9M5_9FIRM|nr:PTS mannose/fructose/sorbose transporter subunit IIAB [Lucifera butyrica]VBB07695.1 phosphotransferase system mannose-type iia component [Lucifera butyrica]